MTTTLVLPGTLEAEIYTHAALDIESAAVLLVRKVSEGSNIRLLGRQLCWVPAAAYCHRAKTRLSIASEGYVDALGAAELDEAIPIWFHTHPRGSTPVPSACDEKVDAQIADLFQLRSGAGAYGTLIASLHGDLLALGGALHTQGETPRPIDRFWSVGERWRLSHTFGQHEVPLDPIFDRNVRAFGPAIQRMLSGLRVAIVGAGGTGSAVAEQVTRLGVRDLILVDVDPLNASNVTRVYGSTPADEGRLKVDILKGHLLAVAPDLRCRAIPAMATLRSVAKQLRCADLIFGCTDDNAGRLVLSRLSTYFLAPVIDVGVLISSSEDGLLTGIDGRITVLSPGSACLVCRDRVDLARASAELKAPEERQRLADEGYAPALGGIEPAVVAFTTAVAAAAVNEMLERLIGYGPDERPSEILLRFHEREISVNRAAPRGGHYCDPAQGKWGAGDEEPFLGQLWPAP
jgi:molybdopterin/thiamine biosynthesis adenylyltransferase